MGRTITEDVLKGIRAALEIHAPHLVPTIFKLVETGLVDGPDGRVGSSIHGKLTATIPWDEGEPVLRALKAIKKEHGYQAQFAGRQISWLVICWRNFAEP
jgi:hypothetical protein